MWSDLLNVGASNVGAIQAQSVPGLCHSCPVLTLDLHATHVCVPLFTVPTLVLAAMQCARVLLSKQRGMGLLLGSQSNLSQL